MSKKKKHKKKFKAQLHQVLQEIQRSEVSTPVVDPTLRRDTTGQAEELKNLETKEREILKTEKPKENIQEKQSESRTPTVDEKKNPEKISDDYAYVKKDVLKIVGIVVICVVILVAIWILSLRTNYISNFANQLANFSHLSQGK